MYCVVFAGPFGKSSFRSTMNDSQVMENLQHQRLPWAVIITKKGCAFCTMMLKSLKQIQEKGDQGLVPVHVVSSTTAKQVAKKLSGLLPQTLRVKTMFSLFDTPVYPRLLVFKPKPVDEVVSHDGAIGPDGLRELLRN
jgi:hypothetical protein